MRRVRGLLAVPFLLAALIAPTGAQAAFPGSNGTIAIGVRPEDPRAPTWIETLTLENTTAMRLAGEVGKLQAFTYSADGTRMLGYYGATDNPAYGTGMYVADPSTGTLTRVIQGSSGVSARFLRDGRILYLTGRSLRQVNADGTGDTAVLPGLQLPQTAYGFVVAPDGLSIYFQTAGWETGTDQIRRLELTTGTMTTVYERPRKLSDFPTAWVSDVSPSGTQLLLGIETNADISGGDDLAASALFVLDLVAGATPRQLPTRAGTRPGGLFSPDGKMVLYVGTNESHDAGEEPGDVPVHVMNVDGSGDRLLVTYPQAVQNGLAGIAWQANPSNLSGTVQQRTCKPSSCALDGLAGVTVTANQPGAAPVVGMTAKDGTYAIGVGAGAWTVTPSLRDAVFDPKSRSVTVAASPVTGVDFLTCGPSPEEAETESEARLVGGFLKAVQPCPPDYIVDAVEITQRVQAAPTWFDKGPKVDVPGAGKAPSGVYRLAGADPHQRAARLVKGVSTIVKVYVRVGPGHENVAVEPVQAAAYAHGTKLADLPLISKPKALNDLANITTRRLANDAYVFSVPQRVLDAGTFMVAAQVLPGKDRECKQAGGTACRLNNIWALTGIKAVATRPLDVSVLKLVYAVAGPNGRVMKGTDPRTWATTLMATPDYLPLRPGDLRARDAKLSIDTVPVVEGSQHATGQAVTGLLQDCVNVEACSKQFAGAFLAWTRKHLTAPYPLHPWAGQPFDVANGVEGATTNPALGKFPLISISSPGARTMVHELLHQAGSGLLGLRHASDNIPCGGSADNEPWPDPRGSIDGVGSKPIGSGWLTLKRTDWYDVMSYCSDSSVLGPQANDTWISPFHWNRLVELWKPGGRSREASKAATPSEGPLLAGPRLRVFAMLTGNGTPPLVDVATTTDAATAPEPNGTITVTARDAAGAVIAQVRAVDEAPETIGGVVDVVLPVASIARLELARDGTTPSVASASATAPTVALTSPRAGTRVRPRTALTVTWTMGDADGDKLRSAVEYSADDGKTWRYLAATSDETSLTLPRGTLTTSTKGRIRVTVSDGLRQTAVTSARLRVAGAPPTLVLGTKATVRTARRAAVTLSASAADTLGQPLAGSRLRWFEGRKAIGRGGSITVRYAAKGTRTLRVVATDRWNTTTTNSVRVVVR